MNTVLPLKYLTYSFSFKIQIPAARTTDPTSIELRTKHREDVYENNNSERPINIMGAMQMIRTLTKLLLRRLQYRCADDEQDDIAAEIAENIIIQTKAIEAMLGNNNERNI